MEEERVLLLTVLFSALMHIQDQDYAEASKCVEEAIKLLEVKEDARLDH